MLKHFAIPALGVALLVGAAAPASADRGKVYVADPTVQYPNANRTAQRNDPPKKAQRKGKFNPKLDFETEAVWRNLRPEWFD